MTNIKTAKRIPFLVNITYKFDSAIIEQTFSFQTTNKKYLKYAYDQRYCLMRKIEKLIEKELLSNLSYIGRVEDEDKIKILYRNDFGKFDAASKIVNCEFYLPPFNGCKYCTKCETQGDFLYCKEKKKHYDYNGIKNCPVFNSVNEIIT